MCPSRQSCPSVIPPTTCPSLSGLQSHPARWAVICQKCVKSVLGRQDPSLAGTFPFSQHDVLGEISFFEGSLHQQSDSQIRRHSVSLEYLHFCQNCQSIFIRWQVCEYKDRKCVMSSRTCDRTSVTVHYHVCGGQRSTSIFLGAFHFDCWDRVSLYSLGWPELTMQTRVAADSEICRLNLWMARFKGMYHYT